MDARWSGKTGTDSIHGREQMLQLLQNVTLEFVKAVGLKKGLSPAAVEVAGGKIFAYGSYRLGVYGPGKPPFPPGVDCNYTSCY